MSTYARYTIHLVLGKHEQKNLYIRTETQKRRRKKKAPHVKIVAGGAFLMSGTKGMIHYSLEIKQQAMQLHEVEGFTYAQVPAEFQPAWQTILDGLHK
jgi:hypothetical protein